MEYGYLTPYGFKGLVDGRWMLFATESEYHEYLKEKTMKNSNLELIVGIGVAIAGMIGIGYAIGTRSKMNTLCEKLDTSIDKLSDDIPVDIPEKLVSRAIENAVQREVAAAVKLATNEVVAAAERDIRKEVNAEVERQYTAISDGVTDEIAARVARIDEAKLRKEVVEKAKKQIADKFDDKLDDLLEEFNGNLQNVGKIYTSIAKSFTKEG